jgi:hypothetical protein
MKKCQFCAEEIQDEAILCKHCGRDLNAPLPRDLAVLKSTLEQSVQKYMRYGYRLVSQMETAAVLERRGPITGTTMLAWLLLFWPGALIYAIPGVRKMYSAQLNVNSNGQVSEFGGTIGELEHDQSRSQRNGWIFLGVAALLFACAFMSMLTQN